MTHSGGNYAGEIYTLTEDTVFKRGLFVLTRFENVGAFYKKGEYIGDFGGEYSLTLQGGNVRGVYINGIKQDTFTLQRYASWSKVENFFHVLEAGGPEAKDAWHWTIDYIQSNPQVEWTVFRNAYSAQDYAAYSGWILEQIKNTFGVTDFITARDFIATTSKDRLMGKQTDLVEEVA
nr:hypothetical protein 3 [Deltaproteobacteria bacterium]